MPNRNYRRGRDKEYRVMARLKELGWICLRSAGSHSPIDVVAINPATRQLRLIQCKPKSMNDTQKQKIRNENKELNGYFDVSFSVV